jgi:sugar/nucleoside kinase (ribokinase family)
VNESRPVIALLGNLTRDLFPGEPARAGGAPVHAAAALARLAVPARVYARCALADRDELLRSVSAFSGQVQYVPGTATASFRISDQGKRRGMEVLAIGDRWQPSDAPPLPDGVHWIHVAPLLRSDFPAATLALLARGRSLSLDGQGLVRPGRLGALVLNADYDPEALRHVRVLKLSEEEAEVLGDPAALPVREVLVTRGPAGATLYADGAAEDIPATAIGGNHTGTGDAFAVSYVASRSNGLEPGAAARRATAVVGSLLAERS